MVTLFLCGDVMTGRGVDQILPHPSVPEIFEPCVSDAREYVALAERAGGPIPRRVAPEYIWGDALEELARAGPDARIINLETSVTTSADSWWGDGINYRMHPDNVACLTSARVDVSVLANNHVLDHGYAGLEETLDTLTAAGLKTAGAGRNIAEAHRPAIIDLPGDCRVVVFAFGTPSSGIPFGWGAAPDRAGIDFLEDLSTSTADAVVQRVGRVKRRGDVVVADGGVDLVHGHSSHHPRPIEVYRGKLVLYGCGDFIDDYEGIPGFEAFRADLVLLYLPTVDPRNGQLLRLRMTPMRIRRMRLNRASAEEAEWLRHTVHRISAQFGTGVDMAPDGALVLR